MPETKPVATVTVEAPSTAPLTVPATEQLEATLRAADGTVLTGRSLSWSTSDETVAAVDASGLVTAVARGSATITATSEGQSGAVTLTVFPAVPPDPDPELGLEATDITVGVELPGGAGIDASQLVVWSALGHETPVAPTPFVIPAFEGGPQLAIVLDPDGHPVLFGFVDPDVDMNTLSARSTAEVMAFFDVGGFLLQQELIGPMARALTEDASLGPLEDAVAATLKAAPHHLDVDAPALDAVRSQIAAALLASADPDASPDRVVGVNDPGPRSGLRVDPDGLSDVVVRNQFRRRATAYVDRTEPDGGQVAKVDISPTRGVTSVFGAITDVGVAWLLGKDAGVYTQVNSKPIGVPLVPVDATETKYEVTVVGPGIYVPESGDLSEARQTELRSLVLKSMVLDFFVPLMTSAIIPMNKEKINAFLERTDGASQLTSIINAITSAAPKAVEAASKGEMRGALYELDEALIKDGNGLFQSTVMEFFATVAFLVGPDDLSGYQAFEEGSKVVGEVLGKFDLFLQAQDWARQAIDILSSNQVEVFDVTVAPWTVNLTPASSDVELDDSLQLAVALQDPPTGVTGFEYKWVTTGAHGVLRTMAGETGKEVMSTQPQVWYIANDGTTGTDQVTVTVSAILGAGDRPVLGTSNAATVDVKEVQYEIGFVPTEQIVRGGEAVDFQVTIDPTPENGAFYSYGTSGEHGSIFPAAGSLSGLSTVTYTANVADEGTDNITVEVFGDDGTTSLGTAMATVIVEPPQPRMISGNWDYHQEFYTDEFGNPRVCIAAYIEFPLQEGATTYAMHAHSFNDTAYWGTDITRNFSTPFPPPSENCGVSIGSDGSSYKFFLSGGAGPASGAAGQVSAMESRFSGMVVDVTVYF